MIGKICGQALTIGQSVTGNWGQGDLNGVIIASDSAWLDTDFVTIQLSAPGHERKILCNRIALTKIASVSDIRQGHNDQLQRVMNLLSGNYIASSSGGSPTTQITPTFDVLNYAVYIDLGCLKMQANDSELIVTIEAGGTAEMSAHAVFYDDGPDVMQTWVESSLLSDSFTNCVELYIANFTEINDPSPSAITLNVLVNSPYGSYLTDAQGAFAASAALGEIEVMGPLNAALIYKSADGLVGTVQAQLTGSGTTGFSFIGLLREVDVMRVSKGVMHATTKAAQRLGAKPQHERRAYQRAGIVPTLKELQAAIPKLNDGAS